MTLTSKKDLDKKSEEILIYLKEVEINKISDSYSGGKNTQLVALFGSTGFLEISLYMGDASQFLNVEINDIVHIKSK